MSRTRGLMVMVMVVASLAGTAHADPARDLELEIEGALTEGAVGDALTASEQAIAKYPQRAETWYQRGSALFQAARMREAADAFRQALKRRRDWPDATAKLATATWLLGDPEAAHEMVLPALRRAPKHDELRRLDEALDMDVACRKNFWRSLDEKSPQWAAQHFLLDLKQGEYVRVLTSDIDAPLLDRWLPGGAQTNVRTAVDDLVAEVKGSLAEQMPVPDLIGFVVTDEVRMEGERAKVGVNVLVQVKAAPPLLETLRSMGDSGFGLFLLKGGFAEMLRSLEPAQRAETLAALAEGYTLLAPIFIELVPRAGAWKVVDVTVAPLGSLSLAALMDAEAKKRAAPPPAAAPVARVAAPPKPPVQAASGAGLDRSRIALMIGGGLVAAVIAFFVFRRLLRGR